MDVSNLDKVNQLQSHRLALLNSRRGAMEGSVRATVFHEGNQYTIGDSIGGETVRQAVIDGCNREIFKIEEDLRHLGVTVRVPMPFTHKTMDYWKNMFEMYQGAWLRSLGGKLYNKTHEIDALVITTEAMMKEAALGRRIRPLLKAFVTHFDMAMENDGWDFKRAFPGVLNKARAVFDLPPDPSDTEKTDE